MAPPTLPGHGHTYNDSTMTLKALLQFVLPEVRIDLESARARAGM